MGILSNMDQRRWSRGGRQKTSRAAQSRCALPIAPARQHPHKEGRYLLEAPFLARNLTRDGGVGRDARRSSLLGSQGIRTSLEGICLCRRSGNTTWGASRGVERVRGASWRALLDHPTPSRFCVRPRVLTRELLKCRSSGSRISTPNRPSLTEVGQGFTDLGQL